MAARGIAAQVERLGRENVALREENAALREIAEAVALGELTVDVDRLLYTCMFCERTISGGPTPGEADLMGLDRLFVHKEDCPVTKARALLDAKNRV